MFFAAVSLAGLIAQCAPQVGARTMTAIVRVESGGDSLLIRDNTLGRSFRPHDANQGVVWVQQLLGLRHSVDVGLSQINSANFVPLALSVREVFDPCINLHAGATILASDYRAASSQFGSGQYALRRAIGAYNSGSLYAGYDYISRILAAAGMAEESYRVPDLRALALPLPASALRPARRVVARARPRGPAAAGITPFNSSILVGSAAPGARSGGGRAAPPEGSPIMPESAQPTPIALQGRAGGADGAGPQPGPAATGPLSAPIAGAPGAPASAAPAAAAAPIIPASPTTP